MVQPAAPGLQACTARYCTKQHEVKSSTRENAAIKTCIKHELYEAVVGVTRHVALQQTLFLEVERV